MKIWAIEEGFLRDYLARTSDISPEVVAAVYAKQEADPMLYTPAVDRIYSIQDGVARISITGPMSPEGPSLLDEIYGIGGVAYGTVREAVARAVADASVKSIVLALDTPGGTIDGVDETYQAIKAAAQIKPVCAENNGACTSAGYWLACAASEITATSPTATFGSIGVIVSGYDYTDALNQLGIKKVVVISKNAPEKGLSIDTKKGIAAIQDRVDATERVFVERVAEGRGVTVEKVLSDFGQGGLVMALDPSEKTADAMSLGMVDAVVGVGGTRHTSFASFMGAKAIEPESAPVAVNSPMEVKHMALKDVMASDPAIKAEVASLEDEAKNAGYAEATKAVTARVSAAAPFLAADSAYPQSIKTLALKVAKGEASVDALEAAAAAVDAYREHAASAAAVVESAAAPATPSSTGAPVAPAYEEYASILARDAAARGVAAPGKVG